MRQTSEHGPLKTGFAELFSSPAIQKSCTKCLHVRSQQTGDHLTNYAEDMVHVCKQVKVQISNANKLMHFKGINDGLFLVLLMPDLCTVANAVTLCQRYKGLPKQRISAGRESEPSAGPDFSLPAQIREFVLEVACKLSLLSIHQELSLPLASDFLNAQALTPLHHNAPIAAPLMYANAVTRPTSPSYTSPQTPVHILVPRHHRFPREICVHDMLRKRCDPHTMSWTLTIQETRARKRKDKMKPRKAEKELEHVTKDK